MRDAAHRQAAASAASIAYGRYYTLLLLTLVYALNFLDRTVRYSLLSAAVATVAAASCFAWAAKSIRRRYHTSGRPKERPCRVAVAKGLVPARGHPQRPADPVGMGRPWA
jgi:hypothetical protein